MNQPLVSQHRLPFMFKPQLRGIVQNNVVTQVFIFVVMKESSEEWKSQFVFSELLNFPLKNKVGGMMLNGR